MVAFDIHLGDVREVPSDLLLLKFARSFHGADETVALQLIHGGACREADIRPHPGEMALVESNSVIAPRQVLFQGTGYLNEFRYKEMREFARSAILTIHQRQLAVTHLTTTIHGVGYGLDLEESLQAMVFGFQQGLMAIGNGSIQQITFVDRNRRRCEALKKALLELMPDSNQPIPPADANAAVVQPGVESGRKKCVFVAMPFQEDFEDVYQFGIYAAVRRCGYVCEKVDESPFAGNIVDRITDGIRNAEFVIADLTLEKPNVYLEVGFAWGLNKPVILVAREGQRLHFDLSHHKCLFYRTIGRLADRLEQTIHELFDDNQQLRVSPE